MSAADVVPHRSSRLSGADVPSLVFRTLVVVVAVCGAIGVGGFADVDNLRALLSSIAIVGLVALGLVFVTISGNLFMLSIGATMAVSSSSSPRWSATRDRPGARRHRRGGRGRSASCRA